MLTDLQIDIHDDIDNDQFALICWRL